jgi:hypothetical protein
VQEMKDCWPFGVALRGEASNHLMLRWLMTVMVSDEEKAQVMCQVGVGKASVSEPLMTCRDQEVASKPGHPSSSGMSLAGVPLIGQVASGMKAAPARSAASVRNVGRRTSILSSPVTGVARGSASSSSHCETLSTVAVSAGGPARSSGEAPVMGVERRGRVISGVSARTTRPEGGGGFG